jgi:hypothetical protein
MTFVVTPARDPRIWARDRRIWAQVVPLPATRTRCWRRRSERHAIRLSSEKQRLSLALEIRLDVSSPETEPLADPIGGEVTAAAEAITARP